MRVVHIIKVTRISGAERHLLVLLKGLRENAVDAQLIILVEPDRPMDDMISEAQANDIPIHRLVIRRDYDVNVIFNLRQLLHDINPNIVHTHLIHADLFGLIASKLAGIPTLIASRHNDDGFRYHPIVRRVSQVLWWFTDGGIAISDAIREFAIRIEGASDTKIDLVRYGLPYGWVPDDDIQSAKQAIHKELSLKDDVVILGMVCRLVEQKGIPYALQAFKELYRKFPNIHLVVAGDGDLAGELLSQGRMLGISDRVHWLGWRDDAQTVMASMDIFLMPSLWEGFGLVLLEAMSKRIPIIASRVSAIPEVVQDGITGLLISPKSADDLSKAMTRLLIDPPLRKHMGLIGEDRLEQEFSVQKMVEQTLAVYHKRTQ
jgi:glycosyltransferase involved in cell wall biosynthesis